MRQATIKWVTSPQLVKAQAASSHLRRIRKSEAGGICIRKGPPRVKEAASTKFKSTTRAIPILASLIFKAIIYHIKIISWYLLEVRKVAKVSKTQMVITVTSWIRYPASLEAYNLTSLKAQILEELVDPPQLELLPLLYLLRSKCKEASEVLFLVSQDSQWLAKMRPPDLRKVREADMRCSTLTNCTNNKCCSKSTNNSSTISWHRRIRVQAPTRDEQTSHKVNMEEARAMSSS